MPPIRNRVRIIFRGLCVFISEKDNNGDEIGKRVVLLDARKPEDLYGASYTPTNPLLPHIPILSIPKAILPAANEPPYPPSSGNPNMFHKFTADEDYILPFNKQILEITDGTDAPLQPAFEKKEEFDLLIPNLERLNSNHPVDPNIKAESPLHNNVIALVKIASGTLGVPRTSNPDPRRGTEQFRTLFKKASGATLVTRIVANSVFWEHEVQKVGSTYPFKLKLTCPANRTDDLVLNLELAIDKTDPINPQPIPAHIIISNMPTINDISINKKFRSERDLDFALAYKVFKPATPAGPGGTPPADPGHQPSDPNLPVTIFDPNDDDDFQTLPPLVCNIARHE